MGLVTKKTFKKGQHRSYRESIVKVKIKTRLNKDREGDLIIRGIFVSTVTKNE